MIQSRNLRLTHFLNIVMVVFGKTPFPGALEVHDMALRELNSEEMQYVSGGTEVDPVIVTTSKVSSGWYGISDFGAIMDFSM